jgi:hypothetical protein
MISKQTQLSWYSDCKWKYSWDKWIIESFDFSCNTFSYWLKYYDNFCIQKIDLQILIHHKRNKINKRHSAY